MTRIKEPPLDSSELPDYKSPPSRIVRSLRQGYDNMRKKVANKSSQIRTLQGKLRDTHNSREEWKERTKELEGKVEKLEKENEQLKKKAPDNRLESNKCPGYKYNVTQILISLECFLGSSAGFRALSNIFHILGNWISAIATPAASTIRQWFFKLGLYKLIQPKRSENGWFLIVDTSIQMGPQKCVVVLGVRTTDLVSNFCPTLEQVETLVVKPLNNTPGDVIYEILEEAAVKISGQTIHAIISDEGSENKMGGRLFCEHYPETIHLNDISHLINNLLKKELGNDPVWASFKEEAANSMQILKLSSIAHLAPPRQRTKARMHSAFNLIEWGIRLLEYINSEEANKLKAEDINKVKWIKKYHNAFQRYFGLRDLGKLALELVHQRGYFKGIANEFKRLAKQCGFNRIVRSFYNRILDMLRSIELRIPNCMSYLGSSEVLESLFGKFKALEGNHASSGLTSLVLSIPGLTGELNRSTIEDAMVSISTLDITNWINANLGQTFLSKRKQALKCPEVCKIDSNGNYYRLRTA